MKILFLDIDGVLNGHEWDDEAKSCNVRRECVKHLSRVVKETDCKIVVSSAWRYILHGGDMTPRGFGYMLRTHGLFGGTGTTTAHLIVGFTDRDATDVDPAAPVDRGERARQCRRWLESGKWYGWGPAPVTAFAAVDDEDHGFALHGIPAVITDGGRGLTEADADALIALLGRQP